MAKLRYTKINVPSVFNLFNKKPKITFQCSTDKVILNNHELIFPLHIEDLIEVLGKPDREINNNKHYLFWDKLGIFCGCLDSHNIMSITCLQKNSGKSDYNTKKKFKGTLFYNEKDIAKNEFDNIYLGSITIYRLGPTDQLKYGFSIGTSTFKQLLTN